MFWDFFFVLLKIHKQHNSRMKIEEKIVVSRKTNKIKYIEHENEKKKKVISIKSKKKKKMV